ncbi:15921_t:CDS:2, partial [Funneliformis caledonium]
LFYLYTNIKIKRWYCNKSWICNLSNDRKRMFSVTEEGHEHVGNYIKKKIVQRKTNGDGGGVVIPNHQSNCSLLEQNLSCRTNSITMPENNTKRVFLEIEDDENASKQRIASLINDCGENVTKDITKSELKTFPLKRSEDLISRISDFLPKIASDNKELVKKVAKDINIEVVEGKERIIEMNLGLGVFEQIKVPSECDIIMDPKGATSNNSTKPKIIMMDNGTSNIEAINELFMKDVKSYKKTKRSKSPLIFKDDDEDQEFSNIIMNSHSLDHKKPNIIVLDNNQISDD